MNELEFLSMLHDKIADVRLSYCNKIDVKAKLKELIDIVDERKAKKLEAPCVQDNASK